MAFVYADTTTQFDVIYFKADGSAVATDVVNDTTPQLGGELDGQDNTVSKINLKDYGEITVVHGATGATETIDLENGNHHTATIDEACTFTFSNPTASDELCSFTVSLTNGGAFAVTWPASVDWQAGNAAVTDRIRLGYSCVHDL